MYSPTYCLDSLNTDITQYIRLFITHPFTLSRQSRSSNLYCAIKTNIEFKLNKIQQGYYHFHSSYQNDIGILYSLNTLDNHNPTQFRLDKFVNKIKTHSTIPVNVRKYPSTLLYEMGIISESYHTLLNQIRLHPVKKKLF